MHVRQAQILAVFTQGSWGNPVPITRKFVLITVSKFSERQIRPFRAFHIEAATCYVWTDE